MMQKGERLVRRVSEGAANVATALMLGIFVIQVVDIIGARLFNKPLTGVVELTGYFVAVLVPAAAAKVYLSGQHVRIESVTHKLPKRINNAIDRVVAFCLAALFGVLAWITIVFGMDKQESGQYSDTLHFQFFYIIYAEAAALILFCLVLLYSCFVLPKEEASEEESEEKPEAESKEVSDGTV